MQPRKAMFLIIYLAMIAIGLWAAFEWLVLGVQGTLSKAGALLAAFGLWMLWIDFVAVSCE
jgi:hypothetical protein